MIKIFYKVTGFFYKVTSFALLTLLLALFSLSIYGAKNTFLIALFISSKRLKQS